MAIVYGLIVLIALLYHLLNGTAAPLFWGYVLVDAIFLFGLHLLVQRNGGSEAMTAMSTKTAEVNQGAVIYQGIRSPYLESGDRRSEEAVVFVHGNPGSSED